MADLLKLPAAAERLGLKVKTLRQHIQQGELPTKRPGKCHLIDPATIDRILEHGYWPPRTWRRK